MRWPIRYALSILVGVGVAVVTMHLSQTDGLVTASIAPLYAAMTGLVLGHSDAWYRLARGGRNRSTSRKRGALAGGIGALTFSLLLDVSIPVGIVGFGLMLFGQALTVADYDELRGAEATTA